MRINYSLLATATLLYFIEAASILLPRLVVIHTSTKPLHPPPPTLQGTYPTNYPSPSYLVDSYRVILTYDDVAADIELHHPNPVLLDNDG